MYSNVTRFTGLSGIDTASMVTQLMKAESYKYDNLFKANLKNKYKQEAYQSVGKSLLEKQQSKFNILSSGSFRSSSTYSGNTGGLTYASGVASTSATVKVLSSAATGKYDFSVDQIATTDKISLKPANQGTVTAAESVDFEGLSSLENGGTINLTINNTTKAISLSKEELEAINNPSFTNDEKMDALKNALNNKITDSFGTSNKASFTTVGGKLKLEASTGNTAKMADTGRTGLMGNLGFNSVSVTTGKSSGSTTTGGSITAENGFDINNLANITKDTKISLAINGTTKNLTFSEEDVEQLQSGQLTEEDFQSMLNQKINDTFGEGATNKAKFSLENGSFVLTAEKGHSAGINKTDTENGAMSGMEILGFDTTANKTTATTVPPTSIADVFGITEDLSFEINGKSLTFTADTSLDSFISQINSSGAGVQATYSETSGTFALESRKEGLANAIKFDSAGEDFFLNGGGFTGTPVRREATDAVITFNGTQITRDSNNFTLDGISFQLNSISDPNMPETINVSKDNSQVASTIKDFVETYNSMLTSIYEQTAATRPKGSKGSYYEPLTDEERKDMSDKEIEEWDKKAAQGLLRNDQTLTELETALRSAISTPVKLSDGSTLSMADLGVKLGDWSTKGILVIDDNIMNTALEEYGDKVGEFMTADGDSYSTKGIAERVNDALDNSVGSKGAITQKVGLSSSALYTASNEYSKKISQDSKNLADLLTWLQKKEDQYYSQFAAMEKAISASNNQLAALSGLFA